MEILIAMAVVFVALIWLFVELVQAATFNEFIDKKIMKRTLWIWLPFYAMWRLSRELIFKGRRK